MQNTLARASDVKGVSSDGFRTTGHPAAMAAPAFLVTMAIGKFHCFSELHCFVTLYIIFFYMSIIF